MKVYQAGDGQWIVYNNGSKTYFATQPEAIAMSDKVKFAKKVQVISATVAQLFLDTKDLDSVYSSEGFGAGASDPIIDDDLTSLGITAIELGLGITLFQQFQNLRNNDAVVAGDYQSTVNALRSDLNG